MIVFFLVYFKITPLKMKLKLFDDLIYFNLKEIIWEKKSEVSKGREWVSEKSIEKEERSHFFYKKKKTYRLNWSKSYYHFPLLFFYKNILLNLKKNQKMRLTQFLLPNRRNKKQTPL